MNVTIYALHDPDTNECRYVGKANDLPARIRCHRWEARSSKLHTRKVNWLKSLMGREPSVTILEVVPYDQWVEAERRWIKELRSRGARLTNFADGGQTSPVEGKGHTEASKEKMRRAAVKNGAKPPSRSGVKHSDATLAKLRIARKGTRPPAMGGWNKGIKRSHCPHGHAYTAENTRLVFRRSRSVPVQQCVQCAKAQQKAYYLRRLAASGG